MSILLKSIRNMVAFDASVAEHRKWYFEFLKRHGWGKCPVSFHLEEGYGDIITMMKNKLADFYINQEFTSH